MNRQILAIAVPSVITNITVPLLGLVDVAIVGHMGDASYIAAISVGSMLFNVIYWIFGFLRMGTSGKTSQAYGRRDLPDTMHQLRQSLLTALAVALSFLIGQYVVREVALWLMNTPAETRPLVTTYFNICIWGAPAMLSLYALTGWFIGMQNTRIPMVVAIMQNVVNILASLTLVIGFGMKIEGVAVGTLVAQWTGLLVAVGLWFRYYRRLRKYIPGNKSRIFRQSPLPEQSSHVNRDIFLRTLCLVAVNFFFTSVGAKQGSVVLAVNTLLMTFFTLFSYVMDGFAYAGEALGGKFYGAGNVVALRRVTRLLFVWGGAMVVLYTFVYAVLGADFLSLLTDDTTVRRAATGYYFWTLVIPVAGVAAFIYDGLFIGMTATRGMLLSCFLSAVLFFAVFYLLFPVLGNHALWMAYCLFLFMRGVIQYLYLLRSSFFLVANLAKIF